MAINVKCPKCGGTNVQLSNVSKKHGCFWMLLFGIYYFMWLMIKWMIGFCILICVDWWMAIIKKSQGKGYIWRSKGWFSGKRNIYYCHDCGHNFKS